ncbi:MAG: FecR domain-containing protein [Verrucomicrobia bacterium]|nr:FecR domain-containing protein [Verrucomicrobiota bacterium]
MNPAEASPSPDHPDADASGPSALDWPVRAGAADDVLAELNVRAGRRRRRRQAGLLSLAAVVVLGVLATWRWAASTATSNYAVMSIVVTAAPHQVLEDGSTVDLKDGAQIEVSYLPTVRAVKLRNGTARFQVAKNPHRPFIVTAGDVSVQAVGTAFCVGIEPKGVEVIVTEGRVSVAQAAHNLPTPPVPAVAAGAAMVAAGQRVLAEPTTNANPVPALAVAPLPEHELAERLTWLNPRLEFTGAPLETVVMTFNQHNRRQLVIEDGELRSLQVSGILRSDNLPALLHMLETNFRIQAENRGANEIVLRKAP